MADLITLTPQPIHYFTATGAGVQPMYLALDVAPYDILDLEAGVVSNEGSVTSFTLDLYTGMQVDTDDGWVNVGTSLLTTATTNSWARISFQGGFLRYIRWRVSAISGGTAISFFVRGVARTFVEETAAMPPVAIASRMSSMSSMPPTATAADASPSWSAPTGPTAVAPTSPSPTSTKTPPHGLGRNMINLNNRWRKYPTGVLRR